MAKILVADDEVQIRELLQAALSMRGFEVVTAPTTDQALEMLIREPFDLVILDLDFGQDCGASVLKEIRQQRAKIPVVIYSGSVTVEIEKAVRAAGANEVLSKSVGIPQLVEQIEKIVKAKDRIFRVSSDKKERPILIVDDEADIRNILGEFFRAKGYKILEAENGEEAIRIAGSEELAVVLLDIDMPVMDGIATLKELLKMHPNLGVVMVTGNQEDEKVKKAVELGAYSYILKPFDFLYLDLVVSSKLAIAGAE
ncbi:response regulator [Candidatus Omnitrophota bacterium]